MEGYGSPPDLDSRKSDATSTRACFTYYSSTATLRNHLLGRSSVSGLIDRSNKYLVTLIDRCSFLCVSGQRGTMAKSMY